MIKLRILLLRNVLYNVILIIALLYFLITYFFIEKKSIYNNISNLDCIITNIIIKDYGVKLELQNKEKLIGYYYIEDIKSFYKEYSLGDKINVTFNEMEITNNTVLHTFNYKKYLYNKKIYKVIEITNIKKLKNNKNILYKMKDFLLKRSFLLNKSYSYICSLLFASNSYLEEDYVSSYRENGISHLFAISGSHISIFVGVIDFILKKIKIKENKRYMIIILFLLFYMFITNFSYSLVRASIFTILTFINSIYYFHISSKNLLLLTLSIIIFFNPLSILDIGFQYSFIISLTLILMKDKINNKKSYLKKLLFISIISFLVSMPITIYNFYSLNFFSILANLFFVPYITFIIMPLIFASYLFPFLDFVLYFFINIMNNISIILSKINLLELVFCKPNLSIIVIYYVLIYMVLKSKKKFYVLLLISLFVLNNIWELNKYDSLTFLDIGQGDSTLLSVNQTNTLIDTGGVVMSITDKYTYNLSKNKIIPYLKGEGIKKLDNLILTHGDYDHMGEAINLVNNFKVEKVIFNCGPYNDLEKELIKVLNKKKIPYYSCIKELNINDNKLYFLQTKEYDNENDNSSVIYTKLNNHKFLFMGDAGAEVEEDLIEKYNLKSIDILKIGHHGSKTSSSKMFIDNIDPKYSIISAGKDNKFGHPHEEVLSNLNNSKVYRTDEDGSIMFEFNNNKLKIKTCVP